MTASGNRPSSTELPAGGICFLIHALSGGGAQRDAILLANGVRATGRAVAIVTLQDEGNLRSLIDPSVRVVSLSTRHLRSSFFRLRRALLELRPAALVSTEVVPNLLSVAVVRSLSRRDRPLLIVRESASPSIALRLAPIPQVRLAYRFVRWGYNAADRVLTLTEGARRDLIANFSIAPHKVAVMTANAVLAEGQLQSIPSGQPRRPGLVVSVGRLSPEKDQATLLRAFHILAAARPVELVLAGDGPSRAEFEALAEDLGMAGHVRFLGNIADPFALLCEAAVAVCSSRFEGFGNAIVEALACGTPVVSTDCPFGPREILRDGALGELVAVADPPALAAAIARTLDRTVDRRRLQEAAAVHTVSRAAASLLALIESTEGSGTVSRPPRR